MNHKYLKAIVMIALFASFNMNAQTLTPIAPTLTSQDANQQNFNEFCGADSLHNEKMKNDPQYKERHEKMKLAGRGLKIGSLCSAIEGVEQWYTFYLLRKPWSVCE